MSTMAVGDRNLGPVLPWRVGARVRSAHAPARLDVDRRGVSGRLSLTHRGRWVLAVLATTLAVGTGIAGGQAVAGEPRHALEVVTYTVQPGDTLWRLAAQITAPGKDVRDVIIELQQLNDLPNAALYAGQRLSLPAGR